MNTRILIAAAAALLATACGPTVSVHQHEDENFNVTAYAAAGQYSVAELQDLAESEARFLCDSDDIHNLGEQTCELGDRQACYSAVFCCEPELQTE